jgi:hypothetical protein
MYIGDEQRAAAASTQPYQASISSSHVNHPHQLPATSKQDVTTSIIQQTIRQTATSISHTNKQVGSNIHQAIRQSATASSHSKQLQQAATSVTISL